MHARIDLGPRAHFHAMTQALTAPWPLDTAAVPAVPVDKWTASLGNGLPAVAGGLEANEIAAYRSLFEVGAALFGDSAFQVESADGATAFLSPLVGKPGVFNRVLGLGLRNPLRPPELIGLAEHFRGAGCAPSFELPPPLLDTGAAEALRALRIRRVATAVVLQRRLDREAEAPARREKTAALQTLAAQGAQCRVAATICAEVFRMPVAVLSLLQALQDEPGWQLWLALVDGRPAGAALSFTRGPQCWFGWAATLPAFRGRGVKGALDDARIDAAGAAGCDFISSDTALGTPAVPDHSLRSLLRSGFSPAYLRGTYLQLADGQP